MSKELTDYLILEECYPELLARDILYNTKMGYKLHGPLQVIYLPTRNHAWYTQAMIIEKEIEKGVAS